MIDDLNIIFRNQEKADKPCEAVLGSGAKVKQFARFWEQCGQQLKQVNAYELHKYLTNPAIAFTHSELNAYRHGLIRFPNFFLMCWLEARGESLDEYIKKQDNEK